MSKDQLERFKKVARELGCDESEERFNEKLKQIAKASRKRQPVKGEKPRKGDAD